MYLVFQINVTRGSHWQRWIQGGAGILIPDRGPVGRFSRQAAQAIKKNLDLPKFLPENSSDFSNADF
jgi:hypothetical protein